MALIRHPRERPVLRIRNGDVTIPDGDFDLVKDVEVARQAIRRAVSATGRIEVGETQDLSWGGLGFLAGPRLIVTTGHTADRLTSPEGRVARDKLVFRVGSEFGVGSAHLIGSCLNRHPVLDVAIFELDSEPDAEPLTLDGGAGIDSGDPVGLVAAMARGDFRNDPAWVEALGDFENGEMTFAPGRVIKLGADSLNSRGSWSVVHDCSTVGGAGGAPLVHLATGRVIGCHFGGKFQYENYAVPVAEMARDPRIRSLGLCFTTETPEPDSLAFEGEYVDAWSADGPMLGASNLAPGALRRVEEQLSGRYPDIDQVLEYLRAQGPAYAAAVDTQPGRGRVSSEELLHAIVDSLNRRGLLSDTFVASLAPSDELLRVSEVNLESESGLGGISDSTMAQVTGVLPASIADYVFGSPYALQLMQPDGTFGSLAGAVRRLAAANTEPAHEALAWLLRTIAERGGASDIEPVQRALDELGRLVPGVTLPIEAEPSLGDMVPVSFLTDGAAAGRSVGLVRLADGGSTCWLISPDLVVAPAHLVVRLPAGDSLKLPRREDVDLSHASVHFGHSERKGPTAFSVSSVAALDYSTDLMLLELEHPVSDRTPLQIDLSRPSRGPLAAIHYPNLGRPAISYVGGTLIENDGHAVRYMLATTRGSAGAPVFSQSWKVVATHRAWSSSIDQDGNRVRLKLGTSVEALVGMLRHTDDAEHLWRRICGAQEALRSIDPILLSLKRGERRLASLVVVDDETKAPAIRGLEVVSRNHEHLSVLVGSSAAKKLARTAGVVSLNAGGGISQVECRVSLPFVGIPLDRTGIDETGDSAIVAVIDDGIDPFHDCFTDELGASRIDLYWDQRDATGKAGEPARTVSDEAAELVAQLGIHGGAVLVGADLDRMRTGPDRTLSENVEHGTAVASIAAGRSTGAHERHFSGGLAPGARLIVVRFDAGGESIGSSNGHVAALDIIDARCLQLGLPVVVNISNGMNSGAHDGTAIVEKACARFVSNPNRAIVKSAGNETGTGRHATFQIVDANPKVVRWVSSPTTNPAREGSSDELELWFGSHNIYEFRIEDPNRKLSSVVPIDRPVTELLSTLNDLHAVYERFSTANPRKSRLSVRISPGRKKAVQPGDEWKLIMIPIASAYRGVDIVHAWLEEQRDRQLSFKADVERHHTVTIPGTGSEVITVGAIESRDRPYVYDKGSLGPNTDGVVKPDLVAPGIDIIAARAGTSADAMLDARSGTSFAAPHVAGTIALGLSLAHKASLAGPAVDLNQGLIRQLLLDSCDDFNVTGSPERGYGRLNARAFLASVRERIAVAQQR